MLDIIGFGGSESMRILCHFVEETKPVFSSHIEAYNLTKEMSQGERARLLCVNDLNENQIEKIKSWWADCLRPFTLYYNTSWGYDKFWEKMSTVDFLSFENGIPVQDIDLYI